MKHHKNASNEIWDKTRICVFIPALNEEAGIEKTIESIQRELPNSFIVVIDNGSTDKTFEIASSVIRQPSDKIIYEPKRGKGRAIFRALGRFSADLYLLIDADSTYSAKDARNICKVLINERLDMVVGDRLSSGAYQRQNNRLGHSLGNQMLSKSISYSTETKYSDMMSGLRVLNAPLVDCLSLKSDGFQIETEISLVAAGLRAEIKEVPITYAVRPDGSQSKLNSVRDGLAILMFAATDFCTRKPMWPMTFFSLLMLLLSAALSYRVLHGFASTMQPYSTTAVAAGTCLILGFLSFLAGVSMHITNGFQAQNAMANFLIKKRKWNLILDQRFNKQ